MVHDDAPTSPRPSTPVPARDGAPPLPTPVRASLGEEPTDGGPEAAARTTAELEVDGTAWIAQVAGMSRSGAALASAPILLIRFECAGGGDAPPREAWVVGRSLAHLTDLQVEAAFRRSQAASGPWARKPLFPEAGSRGGKDG